MRHLQTTLDGRQDDALNTIARNTNFTRALGRRQRQTASRYTIMVTRIRAPASSANGCRSSIELTTDIFESYLHISKAITGEFALCFKSICGCPPTFDVGQSKFWPIYIFIPAVQTHSLTYILHTTEYRGFSLDDTVHLLIIAYSLNQTKCNAACGLGIIVSISRLTHLLPTSKLELFNAKHRLIF